MSRVFTLTCGRTGIHYLSYLIRTCTNLPDPSIEYFPEQDTDLFYEQNKLREYRKASAFINNFWNQFPKEYFGVSLLPKNYYIPALANKGAKFVYLTRAPISIAHSWYQMDGIPVRTPRGLWYHPDPCSDYNILKFNCDLSEVSDFELCLWMAYELSYRVKSILVAHPENIYITTAIELSSVDGVRNLFNYVFDGDVEKYSVEDIPKLGERMNSIEESTLIGTARDPLPVSARCEADKSLKAKVFIDSKLDYLKVGLL